MIIRIVYNIIIAVIVPGGGRLFYSGVASDFPKEICEPSRRFFSLKRTELNFRVLRIGLSIHFIIFV